MQWYLGVIKNNYANFHGRARRKEYWIFALVNVVAIIVLSILDGVLHSRSSSGFGVLSGLFALAILLPSLAVAVRRLHDTGRSGFWVLISLIPFIGGIILLVFCLLPGNPGPNSHGPDPKGIEAGGAYNAGAAPA